MRREIEVQPNRSPLDQLKQGIDRQPVFPQKIYNFSEHSFADTHRRPYLFHKSDSPLVMRIVAIEIGKEGTRVTDRRHGRRNRARAFVAGNRRPDKLPARSALIA